MQTSQLLDTDPGLLCVSAWNDNGVQDIARDQSRLFRTDYFPGLGWMINSRAWSELAPKWPVNASTGWDHWLRLDDNFKGRECIAPEVPRSRHVSTHGTNVDYKSIELFKSYAFASSPPGSLDVRQVEAKTYEAYVRGLFDRATVVHDVSRIPMTADDPNGKEVVYVLPYLIEHYKSVAIPLKLWDGKSRGVHYFLTKADGWIDGWMNMAIYPTFYLSITGGPRATYKGTIIIRHPFHKNSIIVLADVRKCRFLPADLQLHPTPGMLTIRALPGKFPRF